MFADGWRIGWVDGHAWRHCYRVKLTESPRWQYRPPGTKRAIASGLSAKNTLIIASWFASTCAETGCALERCTALHCTAVAEVLLSE